MDLRSIKYYDDNAARLSPEYHSAEVSGIHTLLGRWLHPGSEVLEIGSGSGRDAGYMASLGCKVTATDASEQMVAYSREYLNRIGVGESIGLLQADFPLKASHSLLNQRFDAVVSMAVLMHIPDRELFDFAFQIRSILKIRGLFICSFCTGREPADSDSRLFVNREAAEVQLFFERIGFRLVFAEENQDGLGREINWITLVFESEGILGLRPVDQIEAIINRDKKVATYKLALLRALCEISQTEYRNAQWHKGNLVSVPLGLIVEKWIYFYWPLMESEQFLPQMNGHNQTKNIAFRKDLTLLVNLFRKSGGINAFDVAYRSNKLLPETWKALLSTIRSITKAIVSGPIKYAGGAIDGIDRVFEYRGDMRIARIQRREDLSSALGRVFFDASLWREMCLVGHWISEAIILRWAELVREFSAKSLPISLILAELLKSPEITRDVNIVKSIYSRLTSLNCVWSDKIITGSRFDIDHIIPFSLWHNNDLWNLVPSDQKINNAKRDKIISRDLLRSSEERLVHYWRIQNEANPERFQTEVGLTLLGKQMPKTNWEFQTLSALSETLEMEALQRGVERWSIPS